MIRHRIGVGGLLIVLLLTAPCVYGAQAGTDGSLDSVVQADCIAAETGDASDNRTRVVVQFNDFEARSNALPVGPGVTVAGGRTIEYTPVLFLRVPREAVERIAECPGVEAVAVDRTVELGPSVPERSTSVGTLERGERVPWGVSRIEARSAAERLPESARTNVTVAVIDSGIDHTHPDLDGSVTWGVNFTSDRPSYGVSAASDRNGHGTKAAGVVAAENDSQGVVGVTPGTELYSIKVLNESGEGDLSDVIRGIDAALKGRDRVLGTADDSDVLSLSLGAASGNPLFERVISNASDHAVVVSSAGNAGDGNTRTNEVTYPARYPESIAVAAVDRNNETPVFSAEGSEVELAAPGVSVRTTKLGGGTAPFSGTSAAAPHVAGVAALVVASDLADGERDLTPADVRSRLQSGAVDIESSGLDRRSGYGLVQANRAVGRLGPIFRISELSPAGLTTPRGSPFNVTVRVTNTGRKRGSKTVEVQLNRTDVAARSVALAAGEQTQVAFSIGTARLTPGEYTYTVASEDSRQSGNVTVRPRRGSSGCRLPAFVSRYDADDNCAIDTRELGVASRDFANGDITLDELGEVSVAFANT